MRHGKRPATIVIPWAGEGLVEPWMIKQIERQKREQERQDAELRLPLSPIPYWPEPRPEETKDDEPFVVWMS